MDDDSSTREVLADSLRAEGYEVRTAGSARRGLARLEEVEPDVVLTELVMPGMDGMAFLEEGRRKRPHTAFVLMTRHGSVPATVAAMKKGADNVLQKPLAPKRLSAAILRAAERSKLARDSAHLNDDAPERGPIIGEHPSMKQLLARAARVGRSRATVVIHGESGTGKELIAAAIHDNSSRRDQAFVQLNCAALAESVLESELFGHERGAFTGATGRRKGRFERAHGGTLFLDEVSEIPMGIQVKLLRFLQERELERVGSNETIHVDARIVAATNVDLAARVQQGAFREDLYYRLNVVSLRVPPLRARRSDIPLLAKAFLEQYSRENGRLITGFSPEALDHLMAQSWPGNVRELENAVERAVVLSTSERIEREDFVTGPLDDGNEEQLDSLVPGISLHEVERIVILRTLEATGGSTGRAAKILGISRRKIQYRLREWGMTAKEVTGASEPPPAP